MGLKKTKTMLTWIVLTTWGAPLLAQPVHIEQRQQIKAVSPAVQTVDWKSMYVRCYAWWTLDVYERFERIDMAKGQLKSGSMLEQKSKAAWMQASDWLHVYSVYLDEKSATNVLNERASVVLDRVVQSVQKHAQDPVYFEQSQKVCGVHKQQLEQDIHVSWSVDKKAAVKKSAHFFSAQLWEQYTSAPKKVHQQLHDWRAQK